MEHPSTLYSSEELPSVNRSRSQGQRWEGPPWPPWSNKKEKPGKISSNIVLKKETMALTGKAHGYKSSNEAGALRAKGHGLDFAQILESP